MTPEQKVAFIQSCVVAAYAEIESMKAANAERVGNGHSPAYGEEHFLDIPLKYGLHHNAVIALFQD